MNFLIFAPDLQIVTKRHKANYDTLAFHNNLLKTIQN